MASLTLSAAVRTACTALTVSLVSVRANSTTFTLSNGQYTVGPGSYTTQALLSLNGSSSSTFTAVNQGNFSVGALPNAIQVSTSYGTVSGDGAALVFTTTGPVTFNPAGAGSSGAYYAAIDLTTSGGPGSNGSTPAYSGVSGSLTGNVTGTDVTATSSLTALNGLLAGVYLATSSQNGGASTKNGTGGAFANYAGSISINVTNSTITASSPNSSQGAAVAALQTGGKGGDGYESSSGGQGGATRQQTTTLANSTLTGSGSNISGVLLSQVGGNGGNGHDTSPRSNGGSGASGQGVLLTLQSGNTITTTGATAPAVRIDAIAGNGGTGSTDSGISANGGNGGNGSALTLNNLASQATAQSVAIISSGTQNVSAAGSGSPGIQVTATGGNGGISADLSTIAGAQSGNAGSGGAGGATLVSLGSGAGVTTTGDTSAAIQVVAKGGVGGQAGRSAGTFAGVSGGGGGGGAGGTIAVNLAGGVTLSTSGASSHGILAQSVGGDGGAAQYVSGVFSSQGGNGGNGGNSGAISVSSGAAITTGGTGARGIFAQGRAGAGAAGAGAGSVTGNNPGAGGNSGTLADIAASNSGAIMTSGAGAQGILAMSLGGSGGTGGSGSGSFFAGSGAGGTSNSAGGRVTIGNTGTIVTTGGVAAGMLAQSVGGGGGDAGSASGVFYGAGSTGGAAGDGGAVQATLGGGGITTSGALSHGVLAQSIGGSGGTGGNTTTAGAVASYAVGGSGGSGGAGGTVDISGQGFSITGNGAGADGILAQSIGGGGGAGGGASATSGGVALDFAAAVGGNGGSGGAGQTVTVNLGNATVLTGQNRNARTVDAVGLLAQSIGGGGGSGGGANALAFAVALPSPPADAGTPSFAVAAAYSAGGDGGGGGGGGTVTVNLSNGMAGTTTIGTGGAGSHAVVAQSVGKGGGQGGDSSAMAAVIGSNNTYDKQGQEGTAVTVAVAVGGKGDGGGSGGAVTVNLASPGALATVTTSGDYAFGILAQSVGGGGGNAGVGSANTTYTGNNKNYNLTVGVGQAGGTGGSGGVVSVNLAQGATVDTLGSSAIGILAQSIGGGGGVATGTTVSAGPLAQSSNDNKKINYSLSTSVTVGMTGGTGGVGGGVSVNNQGRVTTNGNDSPGIVAQSVGNGGGLGGSAGIDPSTTGDEAATGGTRLQTAAAAALVTLTNGSTVKTSLNLTVGGKGGTGGNGGTVTLEHGGSVVTSGDYSPGLVAQSIGGGGGRGGTAQAGGEGNSAYSIVGTALVNSTVALGASGGGGVGGNGEAVTVNLDGGAQVTTGAGPKAAGFQSIGILAQSIGGGGGTGADGTVQPNGVFFLGAGRAGGGGASGNGNTVTLRQPSGGTPIVVGTTGEAAHGVVLQSIGAGGGLGGAGSNVSGAVASVPVSVSVGLGSVGSSGSGGAVSLDTPNLQITTAGKGAVGLLAQSIGGGGGLMNVLGSPATVTTLGGGSGSGGGVTVTLPPGARISTSGAAAHGIVAQSIGGGGGILSASAGSTAPTFTNTLSGVPNAGGSGSGAAVKVSVSNPITTTGAGAFGILAQSIGSGGGIAALANGQTFIGSTNPSGSGSGGTVVIETGGSISAAGENAVAIYGQSVGKSGGSGGNFNGGAVTVTIGASVVGGSGAQGAGVYIDGGTTANLITLNPGSSLSAGTGTAIRVVGAATNVVNNGTISGSIYQNGGGISGTGSSNAQPTVTNNGTLALAVATPTTIQANLVQTPGGRITTVADFAGGQAGRLVVQGDAQLAGTLQTTFRSLVANVRVPVLTVTGSTSGTLTAASSALFDFTLLQAADPAGTRFDLVASGPRFTDARFGLSPERQAVGTALASAFAAGSPALAGFFADLDSTAAASPATYSRSLGQLGPRSAGTVGARRASDAASIANASMSCPVFSGATSFLTEGPCVYGRSGGRTTSDGGDADRGRSRLDSAVFQVGGQFELQPGLYLGGALAYETSWLSASADGVKGKGEAGQGAVTLKWQTGPWLLTGAVFGTAGTFDVSRVVSLPGFAGVGKGSSDIQSGGLRVRAAYTLGADSLYVRPYLNVDGIYARSGGYREAGLGAFGLTYGSSDQTTAVITPAVEVGGRIKLGTNVLRAYASAGAAIRTDDTWKVNARLQGAGAGSGGFTTSVPQDRAVARVGAGLQLFAGDRLDVRMQYDGDFGGRTTAHGGALVLAWRL